MLDSARLAVSYARGITYEYLHGSIEKQDSIIYRIQNIGEAANQISEETRALLPKVDWRRIIGMRHLIVHHYREIDVERLWSVVQQNLPLLIEALEKYLE